jgi:hypothetical protein
MAWKTGAGRDWARVVSSVFFGFASLQLILSIALFARPGHTLPGFIASLVEWGVGLAALIQLWQRESSEFFAFAKQAKLANGYGGHTLRILAATRPSRGLPSGSATSRPSGAP